MIELKDKKKCCGCASCVQRCPKHCISLSEDEEGFLYPKVDLGTCIDCGLCEKVCPVLNQDEKHEPLAVYAANNKEKEIRKNSSSGGIFTLLAEDILKQGGVVFGAKFDEEWKVIHDFVESPEDLEVFRGSKYVQSKIGNTYYKTFLFLKEGRQVLFSGTPCQIAGLRKYLRKNYDNLLTVDFICHGAPSPGVFRTFLRDELQKAAHKGGGKNTVLLPCIPLVTESEGLDSKEVKVKSINFRDKRNGWKKYGFALALSKATAAREKNSVLLSYTRVDKHPYMDGFLKDLYLRPSCYSCPAKGLSSGSDITLGDYWGIETIIPKADDDKGMSVVLTNTIKGREAVKAIKDRIQLYESNWAELLPRNPALTHSAKIPANRSSFFENDGKTFDEKIKTLCKVPFSLKNTIILWIQKIPRPIRTLAKQFLKTLGIRR